MCLSLANYGALVHFAWILALTAVSASSITSEREGDTWISLLGTPLEGGEILGAKRHGSTRRLWPLAVGLLLMWAVGLASGSIHPAQLRSPAVHPRRDDAIRHRVGDHLLAGPQDLDRAPRS